MKTTATFFAFGLLVALARAQVPAESPVTLAAPALPPTFVAISPAATVARTPVDFFRALLNAAPAERETMLAARSATERGLLLAKVREYEALPPGERELRLNATQMRWRLKFLLSASSHERAAHLAALPSAERAALEQRLKNLAQLPARLQTEVRSSQTVIHYYSRPAATLTPATVPPTIPVIHKPASAQSAPRDSRRATVEQFRRFFALNERERARALERLSDAERRSLEHLMQDLDNLPLPLRALCMDALGKFATLAPQEQAEFLKSARRWQGLQPAERETWRDFVNEMPPLPPGFGEPPLPPGFEAASSAPLSPPPLPPMPGR